MKAEDLTAFAVLQRGGLHEGWDPEEHRSHVSVGSMGHLIV